MITGMSEEYWNRQVKDLNLQIDNLTFERNMKQEEIERLNNIINKAIEYIKENKNEGIDDDGYSDAYYDWVYVDELLEILKESE